MPLMQKEEGEFDFLREAGTQSNTASMVAEVKAKVKVMRELELKVVEAEAVLDCAKKEFEHYKKTVVVAAMTNAGISSLEDDQGNFVKLKPNYYCAPNKNEADRKIICEWLKSLGGNHLIKKELRVEESHASTLEKDGVPFAETLDLNTNSLKSWIMDMRGLKKGSTERITEDDIPACIHFTTQFDVVTN